MQLIFQEVLLRYLIKINMNLIKKSELEFCNRQKESQINKLSLFFLSYKSLEKINLYFSYLHSSTRRTSSVIFSFGGCSWSIRHMRWYISLLRRCWRRYIIFSFSISFSKEFRI